MARQPRSIADDIESLPHWARVAFAARCARAVLPLFRDAWPAAGPSRLSSLEAAIAFAERSAAAAAADGESDGVVSAAVATAGAVLMPTYGMALDGPEPSGEAACYVASFASKVAEWSARAALADPGESGQAALEALGFVRQVAEAAANEVVVTSLESDLAVLSRVAARGGWRDQTPVPASAFELLSEGVQEKPWWRFW
jgi:hypothetical protein